MDSTQNSSSSNQEPPFQKALRNLKTHCELIVKESDESDWLPLLRNHAAHLNVEADVNDSYLQGLIDVAVRGQEKPVFYRKGDRLRADDPSFLVDGLIRLGSQNLIVGQPKVGKSSFVAGLVAALRDDLPSFVGSTINKPTRYLPVLIFGTDQQEGDWLYYLRRERLVTGEKTLVSPLEFFCSVEAQEHFNFTPSGIKAMKAEIERHESPLVIIDSLSSMMEPTGIEEGLGQYGGAIRHALKELGKNASTIVVLHHTTKVVTTWDWVEECRGGTRLSSIPGWGVLMRWLTLEEDATVRMDRRVGFIGKGRGSGTGYGTLAEYTDDQGWIAHGDLAEAQRIERLKERYLNLQGVRMTVMDGVVTAFEMGRTISSIQLASDLNKTTSNVARELAIISGMGLIEVDHKEETGSRPRVFWRLTPMAQTVIQMTHDPALTPSPRHANHGSFDSFPIESKKPTNSPLREGGERIIADKGANTDSISAMQLDQLPPPNSNVELLQEDGSWMNGWKLYKDSTAHAVTVWRLDPGANLIKRSGKRWGVDVRLCPIDQPCDPYDPSSLDF